MPPYPKSETHPVLTYRLTSDLYSGILAHDHRVSPNGEETAWMDALKPAFDNGTFFFFEHKLKQTYRGTAFSILKERENDPINLRLEPITVLAPGSRNGELSSVQPY